MIRDHVPKETPLDKLKAIILKDMKGIWEGLIKVRSIIYLFYIHFTMPNISILLVYSSSPVSVIYWFSPNNFSLQLRKTSLSSLLLRCPTKYQLKTSLSIQSILSARGHYYSSFSPMISLFDDIANVLSLSLLLLQICRSFMC